MLKFVYFPEVDFFQVQLFFFAKGQFSFFNIKSVISAKQVLNLRLKRV